MANNDKLEIKFNERKRTQEDENCIVTRLIIIMLSSHWAVDITRTGVELGGECIDWLESRAECKSEYWF